MRPLDKRRLAKFERMYDVSQADRASQCRGQFVRSFPISSLPAMKMNDYVIGLGASTFCKQVEQTTKAWASIQGATSEKFGVYFGKTKQDPAKKYRSTKKFGTDPKAAFVLIKAALLHLIDLGQAKKLDFTAIDHNPLSQMFKAKILSLYFPDRFLNICSAEHLADAGMAFNHATDLPISQYQHLLLTDKNNHPVTRSWGNAKFTAYVYEYVLGKGHPAASAPLAPSKKAPPREVDFDRLLADRKAIGEKAEAYALRWEQDRLCGMGFDALINKIEDRRKRPGYGYDFLSHSAPGTERYIEVKAVRKLASNKGHRFLLSQNEYNTSRELGKQDQYFFYLVVFDQNGPTALHPILAKDLYSACTFAPIGFEVQFQLK